MQAKADIQPPMTESVVAVVNKVHDEAALEVEIGALLKYVEHTLIMREVKKERKQWEEDRQGKVTDAIARAMKDWDDENYPLLLQATWGWHPFYSSFVANPLCASFRPPFPLQHTCAEGWDVHSLLLQQSHVHKVYPVPVSVLLIRCFLKFHRRSPPLVSHPCNGATVSNVAEWARLAQAVDGDGASAWLDATAYLKEEGFLLFAGARPVHSQDHWVADVHDAMQDLINGTPEWWSELQMWCNSTRFRAVQDMAFHDRQTWLEAWAIRDRLPDCAGPLTSYERWLKHREDLDIGYVLANPGTPCRFVKLHVILLPTSVDKMLTWFRPMSIWQMSWFPRWSAASTFTNSAMLQIM